MAGFQTAFNDYRGRLRTIRPGAHSAPIRRSFVDRFHPAWSTRLVGQSGHYIRSRVGLSYQDAITGTGQCASTLQRGAIGSTSPADWLGLQRGTDPGDLLLLADDYQHPRRIGSLQGTCRTRFAAIRCVDSQ